MSGMSVRLRPTEDREAGRPHHSFTLSWTRKLHVVSVLLSERDLMFRCVPAVDIGIQERAGPQNVRISVRRALRLLAGSRVLASLLDHHR